MNEYFYGWYFRCQGRDSSAAVIPAAISGHSIFSGRDRSWRQRPLYHWQAYGFAELWDSFFWEDGSIVLPLSWALW